MISKNEVLIATRISLVKVAGISKTEATTKVVTERATIMIEETIVRISATKDRLKTDGALKKTKWYKN